MEIDIVVPVWNRPIETRSCLVSLVAYTAGARFIFIDNGCDREVERMLHDFAEALDHRALLLCTGANRGAIKAINVGLTKVGAPLVAVVKNTCQVSEGWLDPLAALAEERPDAGIIVPSSVMDAGTKGRRGLSREISFGSLNAMLIRREMYDKIGGLDEALDGGIWCLKDYSRRAWRAGYRTFAVDSGPVSCIEEIPFGSAKRREETARLSATEYLERWGRERSFCIWFPKGTELSAFEQRMEVLLNCARQGHTMTVVVPSRLSRELLHSGYDHSHQDIRIETLPRLFAEGAAARILAALRKTSADTVAVSGIDGMSFPGANETVPFTRFEQMIMNEESVRYGH